MWYLMLSEDAFCLMDDASILGFGYRFVNMLYVSLIILTSPNKIFQSAL